MTHLELLRELAMRGHFAMPATEQDLKWFEDGMKNSGDFMQRLFNALESGSEEFSDTEADGFVFCGKCGKMK